MMSTDNSECCLIVGAGICGLMAGRVLSEAGMAVTLIERENYVGGRVVTTFTPEGEVHDEGAQLLTVSDASFERWVNEWMDLQLVEEWQTPHAGSVRRSRLVKSPRYRGKGGMGLITGHLAEGLDIHVGESVLKMQIDRQGRWSLQTDGGHLLHGRALILTPPVPLSLRLIDASKLPLPAQVRRQLDSVQYESCLSLMLRLDGPSGIPETGLSPADGEPIAWMVDNRKKGIATRCDCVTIQCGPEFSRQYFESDDALIEKLLIDAAYPFLESRVLNCRIRRWKHSIAAKVYPEPCLLLSGRAPLVLAGDGFGGPGIEGAALSGLAAADRLLSYK